MTTITKHFKFEAAHRLSKHDGKCKRLHGHSYKLAVSVRGPINPDTGFVVDFGYLKALVDDAIISKLDHQYLGDGSLWLKPEGACFTEATWIVHAPALSANFYPSAENLAATIGKLLLPLIPELDNGLHGEGSVKLHSITIGETCTSEVTWYA